MKMFSELKAGQAVEIGGQYVVCFSRGTYISPEGVRVDWDGWNEQAVVSSLNGWKRVNKIPAKVAKFIFEDGSEHTPEEHSEIIRDNNRFYEDCDDEFCYPDLETEFYYKKELEKFVRAETIWTELEEKFEDVEISLVGCAKDSGSGFICSPVLMGQLKWSGGGIWKVEQGGIAKDEFLSCVDGENYEIPTHSNIEYAKINGGYVFAREKYIWVKKSDAVKLFDNLEDAKKEEESIRRVVRKLCNAFLYPKKADEKTLKDIYCEVCLIEKKVGEISAKQASSGHKTSALKSVRQLKESLLE